MGLSGAFRPGSFERRYAALTENTRNTYYALRRHLGYTPEEVDSMPWWELRMWVECLEEEFTLENDSDGESPEDGQAKPTIVTDSLSKLGIVAHEV